jgi:hypothetical protein
MRITAALTITLLLAGTDSSLRAQSLAEVARKETDRRQAAKTPGKVYTNSDLKPVPQPPPGADTGAQTPATAAAGAGDAARAPDAKAPEAARPDNDEKSEKYWSKRMRDSREQLDQDRVLADALQSRINALTTDFINRDDPAQRSKIGADRQRAINELEKLKKAIEVDTKAITALEEEARRKGIPPGWLR